MCSSESERERVRGLVAVELDVAMRICCLLRWRQLSSTKRIVCVCKISYLSVLVVSILTLFPAERKQAKKMKKKVIVIHRIPPLSYSAPSI